MGADIKNLRTRIKGVDSTLHLTKAMGLVASSKIRRANDSMKKSHEYQDDVQLIIRGVAKDLIRQKNPFAMNNGNRTRLIIISGDRGMAGGYNANVFRFAEEFCDAEIISIGKRGCERYGGEVISSEYFSVTDAEKTADKLCRDLIENKYDKLGIIGTKYISMLNRDIYVKWIFPLVINDDVNIKIDRVNTDIQNMADTVFEPDSVTVGERVIKEYIVSEILAAVKESFACEVAARRMAMDSAEKNAKQMMSDLQLEYNRARQGAITQEITEIVAGGSV